MARRRAKERAWHVELPIINKYDYIDSPYFSVKFKVQMLEQRRTKFCNLDVAYNALFGNMMFIDGEIQISEVDTRNYHWTMWSAAILEHGTGAPMGDRVLIVGDGDGGFTHVIQNGMHVDIVERDEDIIVAGEKYFGALWGRVRLHQKSLDEFVPTDTYDAIILAVDDGFNSAPELEADLDRIALWLRPGGKIVAQAGTDLDPKHPIIVDRYVKWAKKRQFSWHYARTFVQCYFCHENFFVVRKR